LVGLIEKHYSIIVPHLTFLVTIINNIKMYNCSSLNLVKNSINNNNKKLL